MRDELTTVTDYQFKFESVGKGFLAQDDEETDPKGFDSLKNHFGLIKSSWQEFKEDFEKLEKNADANTRYKVLFLGRHGEGFHNRGESKYGTKAWDEYWSLLDGDGEIVWGPDPELTELGIEQAKDNNVSWKQEKEAGVPLPQTFYVSPFTRALDTMLYTWDSILLNTGRVELPLVVEDIRECIGEHTCDKRRPRSFIEKRFSRVVCEKSLTEEDTLWSSRRETAQEQDVRTSRFLHNLFNHDWEQVEKVDSYISITCHSGTISSLLRTIGHRPFSLLPGGMIPVIVQAVKKD